MHKLASIAQRNAEITGELRDVSANLHAASQQFSLTCDFSAIHLALQGGFLVALKADGRSLLFFSYVTGLEYASM
jgi:hypothetical protein